MQLHIPRAKSIQLMNVFQYLSSAFPEAVKELIATNRQAPYGASARDRRKITTASIALSLLGSVA